MESPMAMQHNLNAFSRSRRWQSAGRLFDKYVFVAPTVLMLTLLLFYPLLYTLQMSVSSLDMSTFSPGRFVGLRHYQSVLNTPAFWSSLRVTGVYLLLALPIQMVLGVAMALVLAVEWPGVRIVRALFIVPMVVTLVVAGTVWKILLDPMWGYINYLWSLVGGEPISWLGDPSLALASIVLIDTWRWAPFVTLIVMAGVVSLPLEPFEAAEVDGASALQRLLYVKLPMLMPVILSAFVVRWLGAIKMFDIILTATNGGPGTATEVVNLYVYSMAFRQLTFDKASAAIVVVAIIGMALTYVLMRVSAAKEN